jgi:hypothetical protein
MTVKAVELLRFDDNRAIQKVARYVLNADGTIEVVGITGNGKRVAEDMIANGIPGDGFELVKPDQGEKFLRLLKSAFRGSRIWASDVMEMSEADARAAR